MREEARNERKGGGRERKEGRREGEGRREEKREGSKERRKRERQMIIHSLLETSKLLPLLLWQR